MTDDDWRTKPASEQLVALAFGGAARIAVKFGLSAEQSAKLMRSAWSIVQDESGADLTCNANSKHSEEAKTRPFTSESEG